MRVDGFLKEMNGRVDRNGYEICRVTYAFVVLKRCPQFNALLQVSLTSGPFDNATTDVEGCHRGMGVVSRSQDVHRMR